ncbi:MAG: hypothetical protein ACR2MX_11780 [Cyclobacteriaceae bacterium]
MIIPETAGQTEPDLVVCGGETMMRVAAALIAPASSTLEGKRAVDTYLENAGRLTMIDTKKDIYQKVRENFSNR